MLMNELSSPTWIFLVEASRSICDQEHGAYRGIVEFASRWLRPPSSIQSQLDWLDSFDVRNKGEKLADGSRDALDPDGRSPKAAFIRCCICNRVRSMRFQFVNA